jgi:hypothetical protein
VRSVLVAAGRLHRARPGWERRFCDKRQSERRCVPRRFRTGSIASRCTQRGDAAQGDSALPDGPLDGDATDGSAADHTLSDAPDDKGTDVAPPQTDGRPTVCAPSESYCDAGVLLDCDPDGGQIRFVSCPAGCGSTGTAHCLQLLPTAPIASTDLTLVGATVTVPAGMTLLNSDTGAMTGAFTRGPNTIQTNTEIINGVAFHQDLVHGIGIYAPSQT